jgi:hypothetical protein
MGVWLGALRVYNPASQDQEFFGNPNARIGSVDTSGGIANSRLSFAQPTPAFLTFSASAITATGVIVNTDESTNANFSVRAYEDLEYRWEFEDADYDAAKDSMVDPYTGDTVDPRTSQYGPEATYVWRTPGTKNITLHIRWIVSRSGGINTFSGTSVSTTKVVTDTLTVGGDVSNPAVPTIYYFSAAGSDSNNGTSTATPKQTWSALQVVDGTINAILRLRAGDTFSGANALALVAHVRIETWDFGGKTLAADGKATIKTTSGASESTLKSGGDSGGFVFSNLIIDNTISSTGSSQGAGGFTATGALGFFDIYYDRCDLLAGLGFNPVGHGNYTPRRTGLWKCTMNTPSGVNGGGVFGTGRDWHFVVGCSFNGHGVNANMDHWLYPTLKSHYHARYNSFDLQNTLKWACFNNSWYGDEMSGVEYSQYYCIANNDGQGTTIFMETMGTGGPDFGPPGTTARVAGKNIVVERNRIHNFELTGGPTVAFAATDECTFRDNLFYSNGAAAFARSEIGMNQDGGYVNNFNLYRNKIYRGPFSGNNMLLDIRLIGKVQFTDNKIVDERESHNANYFLARLPTFSGFNSAGHLWDRNQWFARYYTDLFGENQNTSNTAWAAFRTSCSNYEVNGGFSDPRWADAANGDFSIDNTILRVTAGTVTTFRNAYIAEVFKGDEYNGVLPTTGSDRSTLDTTDPLAAFSLTPSNLEQVDLHEFDEVDEDGTPVGTAKYWVFRPTVGTDNNKLVIQQFGHTSSVNAFNFINQGLLTKTLVEAGYTVAAGFMSAFEGTSTEVGNFHNTLPEPTAGYNALRIFVAPGLRMLNELVPENFDAHYQCGISGGGWLSPVWGALDTRLTRLCGHAGWMPLYVSERRDWEARLRGLTDLAVGCDYTDLAALATTGGRRFLQSIGEFDTTGFTRASYESGPDYVPTVAAFATAQGGFFDLDIETGLDEHIWSTARITSTVAFFDAA